MGKRLDKTVQNNGQDNYQQLTKKQKKAIRSYRGRFFKNLLIWFVGVISCIPLLCASIFGVLYYVPLKTLTGDIDGNKVSDKVSDKGVFYVLTHLEEYSMADLPVVGQMVQDMIEKNNLDQYVEVDLDAINALQFKYDDGRNFTDELSKCIKVTATLNSVGAIDMIGDFGKLEVFTTWKEAGTVDETAESFNGNLYYYQTGTGENIKYEKAYKKTETGFDKLAPAGTPLYIANLAEIPVIEILDIVDERLGLVALSNILSVVGADITEDSIIGKIIGDKTIAEADSLGMDLLVSDLLGDNNDSLYEILCSALAVPEGDERPTKDNLSIQHIIDYGLAIENISLNVVLPNENGENDAIYDILNAVITDKNSDGQIQISELSSLNVENLTLEIVLPRDSANEEIYKILDSVITDENSDGQIQVNELSSLSIDNLTLETVLPRDSANEEIYKILDSAVIDANTDGQIQISELTSININNINLEVVLPNENGENDALYEILRSATGLGEGADVTIGALTSFNIDNVDLEVVLPRTSENEEMYKILEQGYEDKNNDGKIQIGELAIDINNIDLETVLPRTSENEDIYKILDASINSGIDGKIQIGELATFSIDNVDLEAVLDKTENAKLYEILDTAIDKGTDGKIQISELANLDVNNIDLEVVLPRANNAKIYEILDKAVDKGSDGKLNISDISTFNVDKIDLSIVLAEEKNSKLYQILDKTVDKGSDNVIQVGELSTLNINNLDLEIVLPRAQNANLYEVLDKAINSGVDGKIQISELSTFSANNVDLSIVLSEEHNQNLYKILDRAINKGEDGIIQIGELSSFNPGSIVLSTVIPHDAQNEQLYKVLEDLYGNLVDNITLDDLHNFNTENLHLGVALPKGSHLELYRILESAIELPEGVDSIENIALGELDRHFNSDNIVLKDFIGENEALEKIFKDAFFDAGKNYDTVTMGDLKNFKLDNVKLSSVLDKTGNNIIDTLIDKKVSLKNLATAIDNLTLYEVYGTQCFTTEVVAGSPRYNRTVETGSGKIIFTYDVNGEYYISDKAGIWLLLCFDVPDTEYMANGRPNQYIASTATVKEMQNDSTSLASKFTSATIRQLVDVGIIAQADAKIMPFTLNEVIEELGNLSHLLP